MKQTKYGEFKTRKEMEKWLDCVVKEGTYEILPNGEVNVNGSVYISIGNETIPVQFNEVTDTFNCSYTRIASLKGAPRKVRGSFSCSYTKITSLEGGPREVGVGFFCSYTQITTLKNIGKFVNNCKYMWIPLTVKSNILGVMRIKNIEQVGCIGASSTHKLGMAITIINKHLQSDRDILLTQRELIQAGLGQFARR